MNNRYRVCFVGLGSIAKRHIRNLKEVMAARGDSCSIDVLRSGRGQEIPQETASLLDRVCYSEDELSASYDMIFITNPTAGHFDTLHRLQDRTEAFFIEKPVFQTSAVDLSKLNLAGKCCYVACPLRYTGVIEYLKKNLVTDDVRNIRVVSASYLPEWRPGTDYRKSYSARKSLGGGVSIDLIHEWDYIIWLIGMPVHVTSFISKISDLEIDSDDIAIYVGEYPDCFVELHLDYFTSEPVRRIEITTQEGVITADLIRQTVSLPGQKEIISFESERDSFQKKELEFFLDIVSGKVENTNDIDHAMKVLSIAEGKMI